MQPKLCKPIPSVELPILRYLHVERTHDPVHAASGSTLPLQRRHANCNWVSLVDLLFVGSHFFAGWKRFLQLVLLLCEPAQIRCLHDPKRRKRINRSFHETKNFPFSFSKKTFTADLLSIKKPLPESKSFFPTSVFGRFLPKNTIGYASRFFGSPGIFL